MRIKLLSLLLLIIQFGCVSQSTKVESVFKLDFESVLALDSLTSSYKGELTNEVFYEGKSSLKLEGKKDGVIIPVALKADKIYKVSFWKRGKVKVYATLKGSYDKYALKENLSYRSINEWEKVELLVNTAWSDTLTPTVIRIENEKKSTSFIDDVVVEEVSGGKADYTFQVKNKNVEKLLDFRNKAAHSPFIRTKFKKKIKAKLNEEEVRFKLKGDWTDHVSSGIWSFKTYGETSIYKDLKTLTFQNVKTRNLMKEWVFIELCKEAGIVTPTYEFVNVSINEGTPYVCALEEDFSNDFIKRKRGYKAPVLRLYEDFLFPHWVHGWSHKKVTLPEINHSYIYCFDEVKYTKGKAKSVFENHAAKLKEFIVGDSILHLIDIDKWTSFFAIQSLTKSFHNLTWHNTRWFVNEKGLIEPVAYDGNTQDGDAESWFGGEIYGDLNKYLKNGPSVAVNFNNKLFMNPVFMEAYKKKLLIYASEDFLKEKLDQFQGEQDLALQKIQAYYDYQYDTDYLFEAAKRIRKDVDGLNNSSWIGKEQVFNVDFKIGTAPLNKMYAKNLIRGYFQNGKLTIVNGVSEQVKVLNSKKKKEHTIEGNSSIVIEYSKNDKWYVKVKGEKVDIETVPWIPLN